MNPTQIDIKSTKTFSLFMINFLFFLTLFIFSTLLGPFNSKLPYLFIVAITLTYIARSFLDGSLALKQKNAYMLSVMGIIMGISYFIYALVLLLKPIITMLPISYRSLIMLLTYTRTYLTAVAIFLTCRFFTNKSTLKATLTVLMCVVIVTLTIAFLMVPNSIIVFPTPQTVSSTIYLKIGITTIFYLLSLFDLWKQKELIKKPIFISICIIFFSIVISEILFQLSDLYTLRIYHYLAITIPLYFICITQIQCSMLFPEQTSPGQQDLYKLNADLMDKVFAFKNTEVQNLRAEANAKNGLYKQLFDFAPNAFLICNSDKITYINQATLSLLNASDESQILNTSIWDFIHPDSMDLAQLVHKNILGTETGTVVNEFQMLTLDQQIKDVRVSSTILYFDETSYIILSLHDLSNDKAHQLIQTQLEENVANEKFKVEFFANISHDLKTPVNVIYSAVQLQDICASDYEYDKVKMYNNVIKQNCLRLQKLLNNLLDMTKLDANRFKACPKPCNIIYAIESIIESVTSYTEQKNISIIFDTNVEERFTMTDRDLIERILLNLISNAIKYGTKDGHIWVTLYDTGNHLIISVKDDGLGIPATQVPLIFKRFHKVANLADKAPGGNGIGLSLVKSMVELLEGTISCISEEGSGSEFIVTLPMTPCEEECYYLQPEDTILSGSFNNLNIELSDT